MHSLLHFCTTCNTADLAQHADLQCGCIMQFCRPGMTCSFAKMAVRHASRTELASMMTRTHRRALHHPCGLLCGSAHIHGSTLCAWLKWTLSSSLVQDGDGAGCLDQEVIVEATMVIVVNYGRPVCGQLQHRLHDGICDASVADDHMRQLQHRSCMDLQTGTNGKTAIKPAFLSLVLHAVCCFRGSRDADCRHEVGLYAHELWHT